MQVATFFLRPRLLSEGSIIFTFLFFLFFSPNKPAFVPRNSQVVSRSWENEVKKRGEKCLPITSSRWIEIKAI